MRVFVRWDAMGCPTRMANTDDPDHRFGLEESGQAIVDLALAFAELKCAIAQDTQTGAVIAAVLKSSQSVQDNGTGFSLSDVTNDATHGVGEVGVGSWELGVRRWACGDGRGRAGAA